MCEGVRTWVEDRFSRDTEVRRCTYLFLYCGERLITYKVKFSTHNASESKKEEKNPKKNCNMKLSELC